MFVLDTDHFSILQNEPTAEQVTLRRRIATQDPSQFFVPIIAFQEQVEGWNSFLNRAKATPKVVFAFQMFQRLLSSFASSRILPFDDRAAVISDSLRQQKIRIGTADLRIASIALSRGMTLLTRNTIDFARIPGLNFEDWTADDTANGSH